MVLAILGTLSSLAIIRFQEMIEHARVAKAIGDLEAIQVELIGFSAGEDSLPASLAGIDRATLLDPWGRPYIYYRYPPANSGGNVPGARMDRFLHPLNSDFDLYSLGKDGVSQAPITAKASQDDIIRANDGGFIGLAAQF
jgi:general secretion pathway protein G